MSSRESHAIRGTPQIDLFRILSERSIEKCYHCHKCRAGLSAMDCGPDRMLRLLHFGQWERVLTSRDVWLCPGCGMCSDDDDRLIWSKNLAYILHGLTQKAGADLVTFVDCVGAVRRHKEARRARIRVVTAAELVWQSVESSREEDA